MEATVTCVVYWHGCHLFNWWHHQTNLSFGSISVLFLLFLEDICRTSSLLSIVEGLRTMMGKCQGWFFWSCWPNFWSRRTRSMSSGRDNSHDQMCSRSCQMWSKPGRLFVKSLWTRAAFVWLTTFKQKKVSLSDGERKSSNGKHVPALWLMRILTCCPSNVVYDKFLFQPGGMHHLGQPHVGQTVISCYPRTFLSTLNTTPFSGSKTNPSQRWKATEWRRPTLLILRSDRWGSFWIFIETVCFCCTWGSLMLWCCLSG